MKNKVILLVEDNEDDELLTIHALKAGNITNQIQVVRDGAEALDYIFRTGVHKSRDASITPQVVLLDLKLPKIDGLEVLKEIRANPETKRLPVVILTSSREEQDVVRGYNLGANAYVCKPVDLPQFSEAVKQLGLFWILLNESAQG
jgi:two-component system, response regulator